MCLTSWHCHLVPYFFCHSYHLSTKAATTISLKQHNLSELALILSSGPDWKRHKCIEVNCLLKVLHPSYHGTSFDLQSQLGTCRWTPMQRQNIAVLQEYFCDAVLQEYFCDVMVGYPTEAAFGQAPVQLYNNGSSDLHQPVSLFTQTNLLLLLLLSPSSRSCPNRIFEITCLLAENQL